MRHALLAVLLCTACGTPPRADVPDAAGGGAGGSAGGGTGGGQNVTDAGDDAGEDAGRSDAGVDAGLDAGRDAGFDGGGGAQLDRCADAGAPAALPAPVRTFYVDSANGLDTANGLTAGTAWRSLAKANSSAQPGDLFLVSGTFDTQFIRPAVSGTAMRPIVYRGVGAARPVISNASSGIAIYVNARSYVVVEGFQLSGSQRPADLLDTDHCTIRDNLISSPSTMRVISSSDNVFEDNRWPQCGSWCVFLTGDSSRNVFTRNYFGASSSISLYLQGAASMPSTDNVISHNTLVNPTDTTMILTGSTSRTTLHCNVIRDSGAGVTVSASDNVITANVFFNNSGEAIRLQSVDSNFASRNLIEHNVVYGNGGPDLRMLLSTLGTTLEDNVVLNNIFWANNVSTDSHWTNGGVRYKLVIDFYHTQADGYPDGGFGGNVVRNNLMGRDTADIDGGWLYVIGYTRNLRQNLNAAQASQPAISGNFEADPQFIDADAGDFRLRPTSPAKDRGLFRDGGLSRGPAPDVGRYELP